MKYSCLVYCKEKKLASLTDDQCMDYDKAHRTGSQCFASEALQGVHTATTVRIRNGHVSFTDGPFPEIKEQLAGFSLDRRGRPGRGHSLENTPCRRGKHRGLPRQDHRSAEGVRETFF